MLGGELGQGLVADRRAGVERVADAELAGADQADDVAGQASSTVSRSWAKSWCELREPDLLAGADVVHLHVAREAARADAHERDAVAVRRVHVRLDLEDEAGELGVARAGPGRSSLGARRGGGRELEERVEEAPRRRSW